MRNRPEPSSYEPEWDARTLADAEAIKADKKRLAKAERAAKKLAAETSKKAEEMRKVANKDAAPIAKKSKAKGA